MTDQDDTAEPTPELVARIGRRLHAIAIKADCSYRQDIADAANALLGLEPDPGSPWDGRPLPVEPDAALRERIAAAYYEQARAEDTVADEGPWHEVPDWCRRFYLRRADAVMGVLPIASPHRGGADDTRPVEPMAKPTPGRLIARILDADTAERRATAERMLDNADTAARCFEMNHESHIEQLRAQLSAAPSEREAPSREPNIAPRVWPEGEEIPAGTPTWNGEEFGDDDGFGDDGPELTYADEPMTCNWDAVEIRLDLGACLAALEEARRERRVAEIDQLLRVREGGQE